MVTDVNVLTSKQKKVYYAIEAYIRQKGIPPTVREIGELVGEKTPGAVQGILNRLEQKGVIKREIGMARSIQLVTEESQYTKPLYIPEIKKITHRSLTDLLSIYNINKYQPVSPEFADPENDCFMIICPDNSLMESGIQSPDMLIFTRKFNLEDKDIILFMYENQVHLRRYSKGDSSGALTLKADNSFINKDVFEESEITIIGKLITKITQY